MASLVEHTLPPPDGLIICDTVIDVGAGIRPMRWYKPKRHICVEAHLPYCEVLKKAGYEVCCVDALFALASAEADAVYFLDVLHHMPKNDGARAIMLATQAVAKKQVVVYDPIKWIFDDTDAWGMGGEYWQTHRSHWTADDFPGWEISEYGNGFFAVYDV